MEISVIVPTLNEEKFIEPCLKSIRNQDVDIEYEIIVCDNNSEDRTKEIAEKYADKVVSLEERGIALARNHGAKYANGRYLLFVDADTILPENYLAKVYEKFSLDDELMAFSTSFRFDVEDEHLLLIRKFLNVYLAFRDSIGKPTLLGFCISVRKNFFYSLSGFRNVPLEDGDFAYRANKLGKVRFFTDFYVITSARRLKKMGTLGTLKYYFEMDLATKYPELKNLLSYSSYVACRDYEQKVENEFKRIFASLSEIKLPAIKVKPELRDYLSKAINKIPNKKETQVKILDLSRIIAELKLKSEINKEDVDKAIKIVTRWIKKKY